MGPLLPHLLWAGRHVLSGLRPGAASPAVAICRSSCDGPVITSAVAEPAVVTVKPCRQSWGTKTKLPGVAVQLSSSQKPVSSPREQVEHLVLSGMYVPGHH